MIYQYFTPRPILREFVRDYLVAHFEFDKTQPIPVKAYAPKPEQAIAFLPKGNLMMANLINDETSFAPSVSICGQQMTRFNLYVTHEYLMVRVNFHPGALFRLLRVPLFEFNDYWFDAGLVINHEINEVNEQLAACADYADMIQIVEDYLISKIKKVKTGTHPVDKVVSHILADPTRTSLDWLASEACLCHRQFNRRFLERTGVGPKLFSRIARFFQAYKYKEANPSTDWLSIALLFNYADYQHMVKDFKTFAHTTPNIWINQDNQSPERVLQLD